MVNSEQAFDTKDPNDDNEFDVKSLKRFKDPENKKPNCDGMYSQKAAVFRSPIVVLLLMNLLFILLGNGISISLEYEGDNCPNLAFLKLSLKWRESSKNLESKLFSSRCQTSKLVHETDDICTSYFRSIKRLKYKANPDNVGHVNDNDRHKMMMIKKPVDEKLKNMVFNTVRMANDDATVPNDASEDVVKVSDQATENFYNSEKKKK